MARQSFAALRHSGFRAYFLGGSLAFVADSIEHVISYWVIFEKFHSPALGGFAVVSHWLPSLLFGVWSGALADRFDPRRIIQLAMLIFMSCSLTWGVLFATGALRIWHAAAILVVHGTASLLWNPSSQVFIHDVVDIEQLPSAVRLNATSRWLGFLVGPAIGGLLLLLCGPIVGIFLNATIYLPLILWLWKAPYGPRFRAARVAPMRIRGLADILATIRLVAANPVMFSMTVIVGGASLLIGNAYQAQMPQFATDLGQGSAGILYSLLLGADAAGALVAGVVLESVGFLRARAVTTFILVMLWCCAILGFATAGRYEIALVFLFSAGFLELSFNAMAQTLVQLQAPPQVRGRVLGLYNMSSLGLRAFSGVSVGLAGSIIGVHLSLSMSAVVLLLIAVSLALTMRGTRSVPAGAD